LYSIFDILHHYFIYTKYSIIYFLISELSHSSAGDRNMENKQVKPLQAYLRWPHMQADQVRGLSLREIGGGFTKHHRAPSIRSACYAIAKPLTMVQKMQNKMKLRGHRNAVYCGMVIYSHSMRSCYKICHQKQTVEKGYSNWDTDDVNFFS
jgi:hypothetical protein